MWLQCEQNPSTGWIAAARLEHVEPFIATLDDRDLAKQLLFLGLEDADAVNAHKRMEARKKKASIGSNKFRQRPAAASAPVSSKPARAMRAIHIESSNSKSESDRRRRPT